MYYAIRESFVNRNAFVISVWRRKTSNKASFNGAVKQKTCDGYMEAFFSRGSWVMGVVSVHLCVCVCIPTRLEIIGPVLCCTSPDMRSMNVHTWLPHWLCGWAEGWLGQHGDLFSYQFTIPLTWFLALLTMMRRSQEAKQSEKHWYKHNDL